MMRRAQVQPLSIVFLVVLGISEPIGFMLSMPGLQGLGRMTSASNSPLVFNQVGGIEFWASRYSFEFVDRVGNVVNLPVTNDVLAGIRGPHTRTAAYVVPIGLGPVAGEALYLPPLRYGLCDQGPLAQDLGYLGDLAAATIRIESGSPGDPRTWVLSVPCSP